MCRCWWHITVGHTRSAFNAHPLMVGRWEAFHLIAHITNGALKLIFGTPAERMASIISSIVYSGSSVHEINPNRSSSETLFARKTCSWSEALLYINLLNATQLSVLSAISLLPRHVSTNQSHLQVDTRVKLTDTKMLISLNLTTRRVLVC
jgi:hypothetical protein